MNKKQRLLGIALIVVGFLLLLTVFMRNLPSESDTTVTPVASVTPQQRYDNEAGNVLSWPTYEHSNQPFFGYAQRTPLRNIAPINSYQAQAFGYRDDHSAYNPQRQEFIRRDTGGFLPPVPTFPDYARVGIVFDKSNPERRFPLFCRPTYPGGNRFDYYVVDNSRNANPLGLNEHNGLELVTDDLVSIDSMPGQFFVHIY